MMMGFAFGLEFKFGAEWVLQIPILQDAVLFFTFIFGLYNDALLFPTIKKILAN